MKKSVFAQNFILLLQLAFIGRQLEARSIHSHTVKNKTLANCDRCPPVLLDGVDKSIVVSRVRENAEVECRVTASPLYEWYKGDERIDEKWDRFRQEKERLIIRSVTHDDSGEYRCHAINGFGFIDVTIQLIVTGEDPQKDNFLKSPTSKRSNYNGSLPEIILKDLPPLNKIFTVRRGDSRQLKCESKGNPKAIVVWYKNFKNVTNPEEEVSTLTLSNLTDMDNGRYRCESENKWGKSVYEVEISVKDTWPGAAEILELNPSNLTLFPGQSGSITCLARSEATDPLIVWVKQIDPAEALLTKPLHHNGLYYEVLNRTDVQKYSKDTYVTVLPITNATISDAGTYCCAVIGPMGFNHSKAEVIVAADPYRHPSVTLEEKQRSSTVQLAVLGAFAFVILVVLMLVCFSRLYGCRSPLKNSGGPSAKMMTTTTKPCANKAQVPKRSPGETLSTTLTQTHNEVLQPLVDAHSSRTTSLSASRRPGGVESEERQKMYLCEHLHHRSNLGHCRSCSSALMDSDTTSLPNTNYVDGNDAMYFVNHDMNGMGFSNRVLLPPKNKTHRGPRDRAQREREKYRKRLPKTHTSNIMNPDLNISTTQLPVPAPSCESLFSEDSSSSVHYYYEPRKHHHHHHYHHSRKCPNYLPSTHLGDEL